MKKYSELCPMCICNTCVNASEETEYCYDFCDKVCQGKNLNGILDFNVKNCVMYRKIEGDK